VRPRDDADKARRRVAAELIADLERIYTRKKAADKELRELIAATGTSLLTLNGIGPSGAARLLIDVGDITRFPTRATSPRAPHRTARPVLRRPDPPPALTRRQPTDQQDPAHHGHRPAAQPDRRPRLLQPKEGSGKTSMEAMRCLKRRLSDIVYRHMIDDAMRTMTGPGGQPGTATQSSATGSHPRTGSSDKSLPGPATTEPTTALPAAS